MACLREDLTRAAAQKLPGHVRSERSRFRSRSARPLAHGTASVEGHDRGHELDHVSVDGCRQRANRRLAPAAEGFDQRALRGERGGSRRIVDARHGVLHARVA